MKLEGIHHVTCITGDAPRNVDYYTGTLGLRLVKKSVNQDDPTVYHLFYADEKGSPGADITFFEYPGAAPGRAGAGMIHTVVWRVASEEALDFWRDRAGERPVHGSRRAAARPRRRERARRAARRRPSRDPARARAPGLRRRARVRTRSRRQRRVPRRARLRRRRGARRQPRRLDSLRAGSRRARHPRRRHRPPRRVGLDDGGARGVAQARRGGRRAADARHRPLLVPLRSTSASRTASCSRSRRSGRASRPTRIPRTSARRSSCRPTSSTCARRSSRC